MLKSLVVKGCFRVYKKLTVDECASIGQDLSVGNDVSVEGKIMSKGDISTDGKIISKGDILSGGNIKAKGNLQIEGSAHIKGALSVQGPVDVQGIRANIIKVSTCSYTVKDNDFTVLLDGVKDVHLPCGDKNVGQIVNLKNLSAEACVKVKGPFNHARSLQLSPFSCVQIQTDGAHWYVLTTNMAMF
jgi:predicted acyltransferase (DUF342 family)